MKFENPGLSNSTPEYDQTSVEVVHFKINPISKFKDFEIGIFLRVENQNVLQSVPPSTIKDVPVI